MWDDIREPEHGDAEQEKEFEEFSLTILAIFGVIGLITMMNFDRIPGLQTVKEYLFRIVEEGKALFH